MHHEFTAQIITIYCLCNDFLRAWGHKDNPQAKMSTAGVITVALTVAALFGGERSRRFLWEHDYSKPMLSKPMLSKPMLSKPMLSKPMLSKPMLSKRRQVRVILPQLRAEGADIGLELSGERQVQVAHGGCQHQDVARREMIFNDYLTHACLVR